MGTKPRTWTSCMTIWQQMRGIVAFNAFRRMGVNEQNHTASNLPLSRTNTFRQHSPSCHRKPLQPRTLIVHTHCSMRMSKRRATSISARTQRHTKSCGSSHPSGFSNLACYGRMPLLMLMQSAHHLAQWAGPSSHWPDPCTQPKRHSSRSMGVPNTGTCRSTGNCAQPRPGLTRLAAVVNSATAFGQNASSISHVRLPQLETDVGMGLPLSCENRMHLRDRDEAAHHAHMVEVCNLSLHGVCLRRLSSARDCPRLKSRA